MTDTKGEILPEWEGDTEALEYLASQGIKEISNGRIAVPQSQDTGKVKSAIDYLIDEWDFDATTIQELTDVK